MTRATGIEQWLQPRPEGLYCVPGDFYIDPMQPVARAVVTHAHADHARPDQERVLATTETLAIMRTRMGEDRAGRVQQVLAYGEELRIGDVAVTLVPAGHVLGSAQIVMEHGGQRCVVSGDYKRVPDPTCAAFEPVRCDLFVTEATFALPVFRHPDPLHEIGKLLHNMMLFPERTHAIGAYGLGKCQRVIALLRQAGHVAPIYLHGALMPVCALYGEFGIELGDLRPATGVAKAELRGAIVMGPPAAVTDRWARRMADPVVCMASGWMRVRQRARARGVELPMVISDHSDWDELLMTCAQVEAQEVWVTHGREEALIHALSQRGVHARALRLLGYGDEDEGA